MLVDNLAGIDPVFHEDLLHICMLMRDEVELPFSIWAIVDIMSRCMTAGPTFTSCCVMKFLILRTSDRPSNTVTISDSSLRRSKR